MRRARNGGKRQNRGKATVERCSKVHVFEERSIEAQHLPLMEQASRSQIEPVAEFAVWLTAVWAPFAKALVPAPTKALPMLEPVLLPTPYSAEFTLLLTPLVTWLVAWLRAEQAALVSWLDAWLMI